LSGNGIVRVVLEFGVGFDPYIGFDTLSFTTECFVCAQPSIPADFSKVTPGISVEGMGAVAPGLNIDAQGTAVHIESGVAPVVYGAGIANGALAQGGGFSDLIAKQDIKAHLYTFTFAPGTSVSNFSVHMLDFGDYNPTGSTSHYVSMTAYNTAGSIVGKQELSYTSSSEFTPHSSNIYGDLSLSGDAATAQVGQPGNWFWNLSGNGIVRVVLEFGVGFDPYIGFDTLSFTPACQ
jgi:hypothetical protein